MKEFFIINSHYEPPFFDFFSVSRKSEKCNALVYIDQNKRTNSKTDLFAHLFGQFVNCIQHIIIV